MAGHLPVPRDLRDRSFYRDEGLCQLALHCALEASYVDHSVTLYGQEITLRPGQFVTGRFRLAEAVGGKPSTVWKRLLRLARPPHNFVTLSSHNRFTLVTVNGWQDFSLPESREHKPGTPKEHESDTVITREIRGKTPPIYPPSDKVISIAASMEAQEVFQVDSLRTMLERHGVRTGQQLDALAQRRGDGVERFVSHVVELFTWPPRGFKVKSLLGLAVTRPVAPSEAAIKFVTAEIKRHRARATGRTPGAVAPDGLEQPKSFAEIAAGAAAG